MLSWFAKELPHLRKAVSPRKLRLAEVDRAMGASGLDRRRKRRIELLRRTLLVPRAKPEAATAVAPGNAALSPRDRDQLNGHTLRFGAVHRGNDRRSTSG
jgi:hypothetical protein